MLAIALGLAASLSWGVADFLGGLKSRDLRVLTVLALSQAIALIVVALLVAMRGEPPPAGAEALAACVAGLVGIGGLAAFYRGLAVGAMAVVAPIAGTAAALPVIVGVASGERPGAAQSAGLALALAGVALASREGSPEDGSRRLAAGVGLAVVAALGIGGFFVAMDAAGEGDLLWALLLARSASVAVLLAAVIATRPPLAVRGGDAAALAGIGLLDLSANGLFAAASAEGLLSVVAVLASLYPVVTILLARAVLGERVMRPQAAGVVTVLVGVALISAG